METAVCTVVTRNHFHYAKTVMESVESSGTQAERFVLVVDALDDSDLFKSELFETISLKCLSIPNLREHCFTHSAYELCGFSKPFLINYVLGLGFSKALFVDGDTCVYHSLDHVVRLLDHHDGLFTAHITQSLDDHHYPGDLTILTNGMINAGFFALRACSQTAHFLKWWQKKVITDCYFEPERGVFCEQKWTDMIPWLFPTFVLDRSPGINVAYWNLPHRTITKKDTTYYVNDAPLVLFHFSGFDPKNPTILSNADTRLLETGMPEPIQELATRYAARLEANGLDHYRSYEYGFDRFSDRRTHIRPPIRKMYRRDASIRKVFADDPFDMAKDPGFRTTYNRPVFGPPNPATALLVAVYEAEEDAKGMLPNPQARFSVGLATWFLQRGSEKYKLDQAFLRPIETFLRQNRSLRLPGIRTVSQWVLRLGDLARGECVDDGAAAASQEDNAPVRRALPKRLFKRVMRLAWRLMISPVPREARTRIKMWLAAASVDQFSSGQGGGET